MQVWESELACCPRSEVFSYDKYFIKTLKLLKIIL